MNLYGYEFERESDIYHHGIKGQKWGVRRFQNEDGSLTPSGKVHYAKQEWKKAAKEYNKDSFKNSFGMKMVKARKDNQKKLDRVNKAYDDYLDSKVSRAKEKRGEKGERRELVRQMKKHGLPGSIADEEHGNAGSRLYDRTVARKGEAYADSIIKTSQNELIAQVATSTLASIGLAIVAANSYR